MNNLNNELEEETIITFWNEQATMQTNKQEWNRKRKTEKKNEKEKERRKKQKTDKEKDRNTETKKETKKQSKKDKKQNKTKNIYSLIRGMVGGQTVFRKKRFHIKVAHINKTNKQRFLKENYTESSWLCGERGA